MSQLITQEELISLEEFASLGLGLVSAKIAQASAPSGRPPEGHRVRYGVALRHIVKTVVLNLEHFGEQWDDEARQDLICTLFIAATKGKRIEFDFREAA